MDETNNSNITWDKAADATSRAKVDSLVQSVQATLAQEQQITQQVQDEQIQVEQSVVQDQTQPQGEAPAQTQVEQPVQIPIQTPVNTPVDNRPFYMRGEAPYTPDPSLRQAPKSTKSKGAGIIMPLTPAEQEAAKQKQVEKVVLENLDITKIKPEEFKKLSKYEQAYILEYTKKQFEAMKGEEAFTKYQNEVMAKASDKFKNTSINKDSMEQAWKQINDDGAMSVNSDLYKTAVAKNAADNASVVDWLKYGFNANRAAYETGGITGLAKYFYNQTGSTTANIAKTIYENFFEDDTAKIARDKKQEAQNIFYKELYQEINKVAPGKNIAAEIFTDPALLVPIPFAKVSQVASKMSVFIKNFGIGAGTTGLLSWVKDNDKETWQYATEMLAGGALQGLFGMMAKHPDKLYGPELPPHGINTSAVLQSELDKIAKEAGLLNIEEPIVIQKGETIFTSMDNTRPTVVENPMTHPDILNLNSGTGSHTVADVVDNLTGNTSLNRAGSVMDLINHGNSEFNMGINTTTLFPAVKRFSENISTRLKEEIADIFNSPIIARKDMTVKQTILAHAAADVATELTRVNAPEDLIRHVYQKLLRGFSSDEVSHVTLAKLLDEVKKNEVNLDTVRNILASIQSPSRTPGRVFSRVLGPLLNNPNFNAHGLNQLYTGGSLPLRRLFRGAQDLPASVDVKLSVLGSPRLVFNDNLYSLSHLPRDEVAAFAQLGDEVRDVIDQGPVHSAEELLDRLGATPIDSNVARATPTVEAVPPRDVIEQARENVDDAVGQMISTRAYSTNTAAKTVIDLMGKVFSSFKEAIYHRYPTLTSREARGVTTFETYANKILNKVNANRPPNERLRLSVGRTTRTSGGNRQHTVTIIRGEERAGQFSFTQTETGIEHINVVNIGANTDGSLIYHTIHEYAVSKGLTVTSGGLFTSNQAARPLHMLSTVMRHPEAMDKFDIDSRTNINAINNFFLSPNKTQEGFIGNALLDLMYFTKKNFFARKPQGPGRQTGDIPHLSAPDSFMNRLDFDINTRQFVIDGVAYSKEDVGAVYKRMADEYLSTVSNGASFSAKGFNTQVQMTILARRLLKDLAEVTDGNYGNIVNKYTEAIRRDVAESVTTDITAASLPFRNFTYGMGPGFLLPVLGVALASPAWSSEGEVGEGDINYAYVAAGIVGSILAGRYALKAFKKVDPAILADRAHYGNATREILDNTTSLIRQLEEKLQDPMLSAGAKDTIRKNVNKAKHIRDMVLKHNTFESLISTIKAQGAREYIEAKARPVVTIAPEKIEAIKTAYLNGDYQNMVDNIDFNLDRIDTEAEMVDLMNTVSSTIRNEIDLTRRGTVTFDSILASAQEYGFNVNDLNRLYGDTRELAEKFTAARLLFLKIGDQATTLGQKVVDRTATLEDKIEFSRLLGLHSSVHSMLKSSQTETARALASMRITTRLNRGSTNEELTRILRLIGDNEGLDDAMAKWLLASDAEKAVIAKSIQPTMYQKTTAILSELWINGLLGAPTTHIVNTTSNAIIAIDTLMTHLALSENMADAGYHVLGFFRGILEAPSAFGKAFAKGASNLDRVQKYEIPDAITAEYLNIQNPMGAKLVNAIGNFIRLPSRFLGAEDDFFKMISYRMKLQSEAFRAAKQEGLIGRAAADRAEQMMNDVDFWVKVKNTPPGEVDNDIIDHLATFNQMYSEQLESLYDTAIGTARTSTFSQPGGARMQSAQSFLYTNPEARFIVPFLRTPVNLLKYFGNRIPVLNALGNDSYRNVLTKWIRNKPLTSEELNTVKELTVHSLIGSAFLYSFFTLAQEGKITGMSPTGKDYTQKQEGWRPYSARVVKDDGTIEYIPMNRMDPIAMFLGVAADAHVVMTTEDKLTTKTDELISAALTSFINNMVDKSYLQGLTTISDAIGSGEQTKVDSWIRSFGSSFVPNYLASMTREMDPIAREVSSVQDAIKAKIPGMSETLPAKIDYRGREMPSRSGWNPFEAGIENTNDPLTRAVRESGVNFEKLPKALPGSNIELSPEQYEFLSRRVGENFNNIASSVVNSSSWQGYTKNKNGFEGSRTVVLKDIMSKAKKIGTYEMLDKYPDLRDNLTALTQEKYDVLSGGY